MNDYILPMRDLVPLVIITTCRDVVVLLPSSAEQDVFHPTTFALLSDAERRQETVGFPCDILLKLRHLQPGNSLTQSAAIFSTSCFARLMCVIQHTFSRHSYKRPYG
jgi:hypothetical protein